MMLALTLTTEEVEEVRAALRDRIRICEGTLDGMRLLSLKQASQPGNVVIADRAARKLVTCRQLLERL